MATSAKLAPPSDEPLDMGPPPVPPQPDTPHYETLRLERRNYGNPCFWQAEISNKTVYITWGNIDMYNGRGGSQTKRFDRSDEALAYAQERMRAKLKRPEYQRMEIPEIALGTYRLKATVCHSVVSAALDLGVRHFDTAALYKNEKSVQQAISDSKVERDEVWVTTKILKKDIERGREGVLEGVERALEIFSTIDLLLLHVPTENYREAWDVLTTDVCRDKVYHVGVSNFGPSLLETLDIQPYNNQIEMSPFCPQEETRAYCNVNDIIVTAHSPLTKGYKLRDEKTQRAALYYEKSPAQVMLNWIRLNGAIPIPRTSRYVHLKENIDYDFPMNVMDLGPWSKEPYFYTHPQHQLK